MRISLPVITLLCGSFSTTLSSVIPQGNELVRRQDPSLETTSTADTTADTTAETADRRPRCSRDNTQYRKEWRALTLSQRKAYTDAVLCLKRKKPVLYSEVTGCKSRFDDFQVLHIKQTFIIHFNAQFLAWHRWFTWTYERALQTECGYRGAQPYWDWTLDAANIEASPLFDGSQYSMSGNGVAIPGRPDLHAILDLPPTPILELTLPRGTGGGCVTTGPFANMEVPFGPVSSNIDGSLLNNPANLAHTPHCLKRDLNPALASSSLTQAAVNTLLASPNITIFNQIMNQGTDPNILNIHGGGHFGVGEDVADTFSSPGDPIFYLHHAQIDRLWTLWQAQDPATRQFAIKGTGTLFNYPPSPEFQLSDTINLGKLSPGGPKPIREFMNTKGGPFCYQYV